MTMQMTTEMLEGMDDKSLRAHLREQHYATPEQIKALRFSLAGTVNADGRDFRQSVEAATIEELDGLFARYRMLYTRSVKAADDARAFRPSYAPAGRPTRSESETATMVRRDEAALAFIALYLVGRRNEAKKAVA